MTSPYFTPVRVRPINTAPMQQHAQALANSYAQIGTQIGSAIGKIGSSYFEDKKLERSVMDFIKNGEEGQQFLLDRGYTPVEIQDMMTGAKPLRAEVKKIFKDLGGVDKVRTQLREDMERTQRMQINQAKIAESEEAVKGQQLQNQKLAEELEVKNNEAEVYEYLLTNNMDISGYKNLKRDAPVIMKIQDKLGIKGIMPTNLPAYLSALPKDENHVEEARRFVIERGGSPEEVQKAMEYAKEQYGLPKAPITQKAVLEAIKDVRKIAQDDWNTGFSGAVIGKFAGTEAYDLRNGQIATIKANIGFDNLMQMREESKTGGALGSVTENELGFLQSTIANLNPNMSQPAFLSALDKVEKHYTNLVAGIEASRKAKREGLTFATDEQAREYMEQFKPTNPGADPTSDNTGPVEMDMQEAVNKMALHRRNGKTRKYLEDALLKTMDPELVKQILDQAELEK